jgi:hypothetical protein
VHPRALDLDGSWIILDPLHQVVTVHRLVELVRVCVQRHRNVGVACDARDANRIKAEADDQVRDECPAQIVRCHVGREGVRAKAYARSRVTEPRARTGIGTTLSRPRFVRAD